MFCCFETSFEHGEGKNDKLTSVYYYKKTNIYGIRLNGKEIVLVLALNYGFLPHSVKIQKQSNTICSCQMCVCSALRMVKTCCRLAGSICQQSKAKPRVFNP